MTYGRGIEGFAVHLFRMTRSLGMEQGSDLLLQLIYLRGTSTERDGEWSEENARRALTWFRATGDATDSARIVGALQPLWTANPSEGRAILDAVLAETEIPDDVRGGVLYGASDVAAYQDDRASQKRYLEEARPLYERLGDRRRLAEVLLGLAQTAIIWERDFDGARTLLRESREIATEIDDRFLLARASQDEAHIPLYQGDFASAERLFEEALRRAREVDAARLVKVGIYNIGLAVLEQGQLDRATSLFRESLSVGNDLSPFVASAAIEGLAAVAVARGGAATAARLLGAAEEWRRTTGFGTDPFDSARADRTAAAPECPRRRRIFWPGSRRSEARARRGGRARAHDPEQLLNHQPNRTDHPCLGRFHRRGYGSTRSVGTHGDRRDGKPHRAPAVTAIPSPSRVIAPTRPASASRLASARECVYAWQRPGRRWPAPRRPLARE